MESKNDGYTYKGTGLSVKERRYGEIRFNEYRANYPHINKMSDLYTLEELIFLEALQERLKALISDLTKNKRAEENVSVPSNLQKQLADNLDLQFKLKEKLGLCEDKKTLDAFKDFQSLEDKFAQYRRQNPDLFKVTCASCGFPTYLKRRTTDYEPLTSSWFKDKVLFNYALFKTYKEQRPLTKKDLADILGVSEFYVDWIEGKFLTEKKETDTSAEPSADPQTPQE